MFSEKYARSIAFLEANARDVIKYRLHRDILHDIDADTEAVMTPPSGASLHTGRLIFCIQSKTSENEKMPWRIKIFAA